MSRGFGVPCFFPPGKLKVQGTLRVHASGIVLRGCGTNDSGTTLLATGFDRRSLIEVAEDEWKPSGNRSPSSIAIFHPTP